MFLVDHKKWGEHVTLMSEADGESRHGKILRIIGENLCKVETFTREEIVK
jgi:hypothetical protein